MMNIIVNGALVVHRNPLVSALQGLKRAKGALAGLASLVDCSAGEVVDGTEMLADAFYYMEQLDLAMSDGIHSIGGMIEKQRKEVAS